MLRNSITFVAGATLSVSAPVWSAQFTSATYTVNAPSTLAVGPSQHQQVQIGGAIGPVTGATEVIITLSLDFEFVENVIAGDLLISRLQLRPDFNSGVFAVTEMRLSASVFDEDSLVWGVQGVPFQPLQSVGDNDLRSYDIFTDTFEGPGPAFSTIADRGEGSLVATFRWTGFNPADHLTIDFSPGGGASFIQYWNFIPAPGGGAAIAGALLFSARRRGR